MPVGIGIAVATRCTASSCNKFANCFSRSLVDTVRCTGTILSASATFDVVSLLVVTTGRFKICFGGCPCVNVDKPASVSFVGLAEPVGALGGGVVAVVFDTVFCSIF